ncbi:DMT family transporter [Acidiferrimicrobium sp. IK]|uniref:DMT family transporter n=1 Tax=Acidiferrimicrobium sp. IK TaxID=2871700 RepID=UPI0021CAFB08|nr:DMT family transporter [Acidiferrimicrobium sp. IK]MCU4183110.1 DMT family transporter [Acidiferrimicrobium sp. IK]
MLGYLLAALTAATNAASNVAQRRADREQPQESSFSRRMIVDLLHRRDWLLGVSAVIVSFLLQAAALHAGTLAAVQPIVILELPMTLVGASWFLHARMGRREWAASTLLTVGVAAVVGGLTPAGGSTEVAARSWVVALGASLAGVAALIVAALRVGGERRGALLGAATGVMFGLTAALMDAATQAMSRGPAALFSAWTTYAMAAAGIGAMYLMQNALQSGRLVAAQPGITLLDPVTSILWGTLVFGEQVGNGGAGIALAAAGAASMVAGAVVLTRSPALADDQPAGRRNPAA